MFSSLSRQRRCLFRFENSSDPLSRSSSLSVDRLEIITHAYFQLISVLRNGKIIVSLSISPTFRRVFPDEEKRPERQVVRLMHC